MGENGEVLLSWPALYRPCERWPAVLLLWVMALTAALVGAAISWTVVDLLNDPAPTRAVYWLRIGVSVVLVGVVVAAAVVIVKIMLMMVRLVRFPAPVRLALQPTALIYDAGDCPADSEPKPLLAMESARRLMEFPRDELRVRLVGLLPGEQHLYLDTSSGDSFEIGQELTVPDREWLAQVIRCWMHDGLVTSS
jgi:hypothetical protein